MSGIGIIRCPQRGPDRDRPCNRSQACTVGGGYCPMARSGRSDLYRLGHPVGPKAMARAGVVVEPS